MLPVKYWHIQAVKEVVNYCRLRLSELAGHDCVKDEPFPAGSISDERYKDASQKVFQQEAEESIFSFRLLRLDDHPEHYTPESSNQIRILADLLKVLIEHCKEQRPLLNNDHLLAVEKIREAQKYISNNIGKHKYRDEITADWVYRQPIF